MENISPNQSPVEFFRDVIEPLCDSFDPAQAKVYEEIMREFIPQRVAAEPVLPAKVETVYVLSRVTLGADIKVSSVLLDAAKKAFVSARIVFVGGRKSSELFANDSRVEGMDVTYPRGGTVADRLHFAQRLSEDLSTPNSIVLDPDSRISQLGLLPVGNPNHYFHFPSRTTDGENLSTIVEDWTEQLLGVRGKAYIAPKFIEVEGPTQWAAVSLGVGDNPSKRLRGSFEADLIALLASRYQTVWLDRGAGGEEAERVTKAAEGHAVRFWEGSFAGFTSVISQSDLYVGYDSGGQHAAAAAKTPLVSIFAGAPSPRFRQRWSPCGYGPCTILDADTLTPAEILAKIVTS